MSLRAGAVALAALAAAGGLWLARRQVPAPEPSPGGGPARSSPAASPEPPGPAVERTRRLLLEGVQLRREIDQLRRSLAAITNPPVVGLPVAPPGLYSPDEIRLLDQVYERAAAELRPRAERLYRELVGAAPPALGTDGLFSAIFDATQAESLEALQAEDKAVRALREQKLAPAADAAPLRRALWLLWEAGDAVERDVREALPPDRFEELARLPHGGFGYSISRENERWVVRATRPGA